MVVPTSENSSFFYTTDESFGRDEYLKRSALASSQLQNGVNVPGTIRSHSIDSLNTRSQSQEKYFRHKNRDPTRAVSSEVHSSSNVSELLIKEVNNEELMTSHPTLKTPLLQATRHGISN